MRYFAYFAFVAPLVLNTAFAFAAPAATPPASASSTTAPSTTPRFDVAMPRDAFERHILNRFSFGPRPGDVERLHRIGYAAWLDEQLSPQTLDTSEINAQVAELSTLQLPRETLLLAYAGDSAGFIKRAMGRKPQKVAVDVTMPGGVAAPAAPPMMEQLKPRQQEILARYQAANLPQGLSVRALGELATEKLMRATASPAQLQEVLVDFWSNHFNIDARKGPCRVLKVSDEREVVRPRVLGRFRDLLGASAHSPAMLFYLDNARSTREYGSKPDGKRRGGLNENYARELMELHTLGVDGGYTQKDVTEVARCFTGWSFDPQSGAFVFRARAHDDGEKLVLGERIPAGGGKRDGERALDILATSPATASHIARELCQRFVSDSPPPALIARVASTFTSTNGDLRAVIKTLATSPEFASAGAYRAKIKSPWEFAVSALRALNARVEVPGATRPALSALRLTSAGRATLGRNGKGPRESSLLLAQIATMGQPIFGCQAPTGYPEDASAWVSSGALISRLNFALALSNGQLLDARLPRAQNAQTTDADALLQTLLGGDARAETRRTLQRESAQNADTAKLTALVLGSPEFQRR